MIPIKSPRELTLMRKAGKIVAEAMAAAEAAITPGVTTKQLEAVVRQVIEAHGAKSSFYRYRDYPAHACVSVNEEVIHGIPSGRKLQNGDIVSLDIGACCDGYHADSAATFAVGTINGEAQLLIDVTKQCFYQALAQCRKGRRIIDISRAIENHAIRYGYACVQDFTGHGVGVKLHEAPEIPSYDNGKRGPRLLPGMTVAIEPMVISGGDHAVEVLGNKWTVVSKDRSLTAHYEHTVLITDSAPELLTLRDGDVILPLVGEETP